MTLHKLNSLAQNVVNKIMSSDAIDIEQDGKNHDPILYRIPTSNITLLCDSMVFKLCESRTIIISNEDLNKLEIEENVVFAANNAIQIYNLQQVTF